MKDIVVLNISKDVHKRIRILAALKSKRLYEIVEEAVTLLENNMESRNEIV